MRVYYFAVRDDAVMCDRCAVPVPKDECVTMVSMGVARESELFCDTCAIEVGHLIKKGERLTRSCDDGEGSGA